MKQDSTKPEVRAQIDKEIADERQRNTEALSFYHPSHPAYGICPNCYSNMTLARELIPTRICLACGFAEDFSTCYEAQIGWKRTTIAKVTEHAPLDEAATLKLQKLYSTNGD